MRSTGSTASWSIACTVLVALLTGCGQAGEPGAELTGAPPSTATTESSNSTEPPDSTDSPTASETPMSPENPSPSSSSKPVPSFPKDPAAAGTAMLTISIKQNPDSAAAEYVLECTKDGVGAATTVRNPEAACEAVRRLGSDFFNAKPDPNRMCTQQYGGPQTATVSGTVDGQRVHASFSATDGCEIARWNALQTILGPAGAS